jgi:hypothetical protein
MVPPIPKVRAIIRSPMKTVARSPFKVLQLQPALVYMADWEQDEWGNWNGQLFYNVAAEKWLAILINPELYEVYLEVVGEEEDRDFDVIDAGGNVVDTETIHLDARTWLLRTQHNTSVYDHGTETPRRADHWYYQSGSWTPKGVYELLLNASPDCPIGFNGLIDPVTITVDTS